MPEPLAAPYAVMGHPRRPRLDQELDIEIGRRLRARRRTRGLTLQELASISGLTVQQIQRSEAGAARVTVVVLLRLAEALKTHPLALMPEMTPDDRAPASRQADDAEAATYRPTATSARDLALALADLLSKQGQAQHSAG